MSTGIPIDAVINAVDDCDPAAAREVLDPITDDGEVTREAIEAAVSDASKLLATAETRVELAGHAHEDAVDAADSVADLTVVRTRLDGFAERLSAVQSRAAGLRPDLTAPADLSERPRAAYELATDLRTVATAAQGVATTADDLSFDIEEFRSLLRRPARRHEEFVEDVGLVADSIEGVGVEAAKLSDDAADPAVRWADATMRARVLSLLVSDLRAELRGLRALAERDGSEIRSDLPRRVKGIERRVVEIEAELETRAERAWRDRFGDDLASFDATLAAFDPPVEWGAVERMLEEHRPTTTASDVE